MCQTDDNCIDQCLDGRPDAFRQLVLRYERPLMCYLIRRLGDPDAASEVAQESLVRAYFGLTSLKKGKAFFSWLLGIAQHVILERFRRHRRESSLPDTMDVVDPAGDASVNDDCELAAAVEKLPDIYREVTVLRYFGDLSCVEVSERLGIPLSTVTKRLSRAYSLLREALAPNRSCPNEVRP